MLMLKRKSFALSDCEMVRHVEDPHDREYFSRNRGLNNKGLNPWVPSFKLIVSNEDVRNVFGTASPPILLSKPHNIDGRFLRALKNNVLGKGGSNCVSLAFARGAIATYRGLDVDWAGFAFLAQFRGPLKRAKLFKLNKSLAAGSGEQDSGGSDEGEATFAGMDKVYANSKVLDEVVPSLHETAVNEDRIEMIRETQAELTQLRLKQIRVEMELLAVETAVLESGTGWSREHEKWVLVQELDKLNTRETKLQRDFFTQLCRRGAGVQPASESLAVFEKPNTYFDHVEAVTTETNHLELDEQQSCFLPLEAPQRDLDDTFEAKMKALAERIFTGSSFQQENNKLAQPGLKPAWRRL